MLPKLFDFQQAIVDKYKHKNKLGLFLDMGLGKTIVSLAFCQTHDIDSIIVISIKSKSSETSEIKGSFADYLTQMGLNVYHLNTKGTPPPFQPKQALILNYERLNDASDKKSLNHILVEFLNHSKNKKIGIIVDESHKIKNPNSMRSKMLSKLLLYAQKLCQPYLYLLTGTPFTKGFIDLFNQLHLLGLNMSKTEFMDRYTIRGDIKGLLNWQQPIIGYKNVDALFNLVARYAVTELTEKTIKLPEQNFIYLKTPISDSFNVFTIMRPGEKRLKQYCTTRGLPYEKVNLFYNNIDYPTNNYMAETPAHTWLRARQLSIGFNGNEDDYKWYDFNRIKLLEEFLSNNVDNYLIFYNYSPELYTIFEICEHLGYLVDIYNGHIKDTTFYDNYANLNATEQLNHKKRVLITNFASGSTGKNWQAYNKSIFFSLPLYGDYAQALKRNHRLGQERPVFYYIFYQDNFLDRAMLKALKEKTNYNLDMFNYELKLNNE